MGKITMQEIADSLGISRVSVWKAMNGHEGVSEALKEKIIKKASELGYYKTSLIPASLSVPFQEKTVSLIVSRPDSSTFWTNIIHRMAKELSLHNINLLYTYVPSSFAPNYTFPALLTNGTVDGVIVLNVYDSSFIQKINDLSLPTVFLDTVPDIPEKKLQGDLILIEGFSSLYKITESVIQKGIKDIGFIGDIYYSKTNLDRYHGFCKCMTDYGLSMNPKASLTQPIGIFSYYQELTKFLNSLEEMPQAFICVSDYIAHYLQIYFAKHPHKIPGGILITGFDGNKEYRNIDGMITTTNVKTGLLGARLSHQIIYRMEHSDAPFELTYIKPEIIYHSSILQF